jgi:SAM-dependent methyltransferase
MFFPERIKSIKANDKVLEVGPGATPHPRSDIFLELKYDSIEERIAQSGHVGPLQTQKPIIYYDGTSFPFDDDEFDYVICSHVLEHIHEPEKMVSELTRVAKKGYIEFPTVYYEYIWNFPEHVTILFWDGEKIYYLPKAELHLDNYKPITDYYYNIMPPSSINLVNRGKNYLIQGFEWENKIEIKNVDNISQVTYSDFNNMPVGDTDVTILPFRSILSYLGGIIRRIRVINR